MDRLADLISQEIKDVLCVLKASLPWRGTLWAVLAPPGKSAGTWRAQQPLGGWTHVLLPPVSAAALPPSRPLLHPSQPSGEEDWRGPAVA